MNFLGRTFVLIILCASIGFFFAAVFANSSHMDYKEKLTALRDSNKQLTGTVNAAKEANEKLQTTLLQEQYARTAALAALQQQLALQLEELLQANKRTNDLNSVNTLKTSQLSETLDRLKATQSLNDTLRAENDKVITDRNTQRKKVVELTDQLNAIKSIENDLREQVALLREEATINKALADTRANALKAAGITDVEDVPPADVHGQVLAVSGKQLEISLGRDDGIRTGHTSLVFKSNERKRTSP
jgi:chromosome segregation ATPase